MASVDLISGFRTTFFESFSGSLSSLEQASKRSFTLRSKDGQLSQKFTGTFVLNNKRQIKSGRISSFSVLLNDQPAWTVSGIDLGIKSYSDLFTSSKKAAFDGLFGGADTFVGSDESDTLLSYAGNDSINANGGNDILDAGIGEDILIAGEGNDSLLGGDGEDILDGGQGDDNVDGGINADRLTGGLGSDIFTTRDGASPELTAVEFNDNFFPTKFVAGNGIDIITDFEAIDKISFNGQIVSPLFNSDPYTSLGSPVFLPGNWLEDSLASGLNRGRFEYDADGRDLFFFVNTPWLDTLLDGNLLEPGIFGSQLFVLLDASKLLESSSI
jgi:Ca2+-binding RTX toxin-like protein